MVKDQRLAGFTTFATCRPSPVAELDRAAKWLREYAELYQGRIITNFDQQRPSFEDAPFSLQNIASGNIDQQLLLSLNFEKVGQMGNIIIHGNVGPGAAIGHGASVEAKNIASRDIHDLEGGPSLTWEGDIDLSLPSIDDTRAGAKRSWFIRLKVTNAGQVTARNCFGRLHRVTDEQGRHLKRFDSLNLYWTRQDTPQTFAPIDIRENGDFQYLDVAQVIEAENALVLRVVVPDGHRLVNPSGHTHRPEGLLPGTYYLQTAIYADNGSIGSTWFKIEWNDDYSIEPHPCSIAFDNPPDNN